MEAHGLATSKKNAARLAAHVIFIDESGFSLIPSVRKTWAPRGETPVVRHWYRHDKVSAISGLAVNPRRKRVRLYCQLYEQNIQSEEVCFFLRDVLRHVRGYVIVVLDNGKIHKGDMVGELCERFPRLLLEPFPAYAPELNPDEGVWNHLKAVLANSRPDSAAELMDRLSEEVQRLAGSQAHLRACITQSDLPPFLR